MKIRRIVQGLLGATMLWQCQAHAGPTVPVVWGYDFYHVTNVPPAVADVTKLAGGVNHILALTDDGRVLPWGSDSLGQRDVPTDLVNVAAVAAGAGHSMVLFSNGTVKVYGQPNFGTTNIISLNIGAL